MKKVLNNIKKVMAVFVLSVVMVSAISPAVQASVDLTTSLVYDGGYKAKTSAEAGYDDRGYAYNVVVYARVGTSKATERYKNGLAKASVTSGAMSSKPTMTRHGWGYGKNNSDVDHWYNIYY